MSSVRSFLGDNALRILAALVLVPVLVIAGGFATGVLGTPSVEGVDNRFGAVTDETTEIQTNVSVRNPNPVGLSLDGTTITYNMSANGVPLATGEKEGITIGSGDSTIHSTTRMQNDRIPDWWVSHLQNGEQSTMSVDATVDVGLLGQSFDVQQQRSTSTDVLAEFNTSEPHQVNAEAGPAVQDPILNINETSGWWGDVSQSETPINMEFKAHNPQTLQPVTITTIGYNITMNDLQVGSGEVEQNRVIRGGQTKTIPLTTVIDNQRLDEWWVSHLERNQVTEFKIEFSANVELQDGTTDTVPMDAISFTETIETDILGSKPTPDEYVE